MKYRNLLWGLCVMLAIGLSACNKPPQQSQTNSPPAASPSAVTGAADDGMITTKVKAAFLADNDVKSTSINVETTNGVVKLSGTVDNQTQIDRAVEIARKVEGVSSVTNQLTLKK